MKHLSFLYLKDNEPGLSGCYLQEAIVSNIRQVLSPLRIPSVTHWTSTP